MKVIRQILPMPAPRRRPAPRRLRQPARDQIRRLPSRLRAGQILHRPRPLMGRAGKSRRPADRTHPHRELGYARERWRSEDRAGSRLRERQDERIAPGICAGSMPPITRPPRPTSSAPSAAKPTATPSPGTSPPSSIPPNPLARVQMTQWMYLQPDGRTMINRDSIRKAGVILAYATEEFRKESR